MMNMDGEAYLSSVKKQFQYYRTIGQKAISQLSEAQMYWQPAPDENSVAIIVKHLHGNMLSRWTDFKLSDGEKAWRNRDAEFTAPASSLTGVLEQWNQGWDCLFAALDRLGGREMDDIVYIRNMGQTASDAINRQLCHYGYHVGQIVLLAKIQKGQDWVSLSIPKGSSKEYNTQKFSKEKRIQQFTDEE